MPSLASPVAAAHRTSFGMQCSVADLQPPLCLAVAVAQAVSRRRAIATATNFRTFQRDLGFEQRRAGGCPPGLQPGIFQHCYSAGIHSSSLLKRLLY